MTPNNNLSVLPFYTQLAEQNHRKSYAYGDIYPLFSPNNNILPFQIIRPNRANQITGVALFKADGTFVAYITDYIKEGNLTIKQFPALGYDVIVYPGIGSFPVQFPIGQYYLGVYDGVTYWYSDVFTMVNDLSGYLKIEWWDIDDMVFDGGRIIYGVPPIFKNTLYVFSELGKPDYVFEEDGEDRDGYFFPEKQISEKTYNFTMLAPEFLCDAMRIIRMSDYVLVTDKYGRQYDCDTFLITPKWQTQGNIASVECEFQCATVIKKIGRGYIQRYKGDYNKDFNNDFNNAD